MSDARWRKRLELYDEIVEMCQDFERKGKTMPYTSANGHMFSLLNKDGELGIRLSREDGKQFMEEYDATIFKSHGAVMRGYVRIPETMLDDADLLVSWFNKSYQHITSLEPKPTTKKSSSKKSTKK